MVKTPVLASLLYRKKQKYVFWSALGAKSIFVYYSLIVLPVKEGRSSLREQCFLFSFVR